MPFEPRLYSRSRGPLVTNYLDLIRTRAADALHFIDGSLSDFVSVHRSSAGVIAVRMPTLSVVGLVTEIEESEDGARLDVTHTLDVLMKLTGVDAEALAADADSYLSGMDALTRALPAEELLDGAAGVTGLNWDVVRHDNDSTRGSSPNFVQLPNYTVKFNLTETI